MSESLHNDNDDLFRKAYGDYEEEPSPDVWNKLNANLDKREAVFYRASTVAWKRVAYALLLIVVFFVGYELGFKKTGKPDADEVEKQRKVQIDSSELVKNLAGNQYSSDTNATASLNEAQSINQKKQARISIEKSSSSAFENHVNKAFSENDEVSHDANKIATDLSGERVSKASINHNGLTENLLRSKETESFFDTVSENKLTASSTARQENQISSDTSKSGLFFNHKRTDQTRSVEDLGLSQPELPSSGSIKKQVDSSAFQKSVTATTTTLKANHLFRSRWSITPFVSFDFTGQELDNDHDHDEPGQHDERREIKDREDDEMSYSTGLLAKYQFSKKWVLKSGLLLSNSSVRSNAQTLYASQNNQSVNYKLVTSNGYAYVNPSFDPMPAPGDSIHAEHARVRLHYLSVPLMAGYVINLGRKISLIPGAGFSVNWLIGSKLQTELRGDDDDQRSSISLSKIQGLQKLNFSFLTQTELNYHIGAHWDAMLLPSFQYAINPVTKEHVVKTYPYKFGLGMGLTYSF